MQLVQNKLSIKVNDNGELFSIIYNKKEFLHEGKKWWLKTFPIIFPTIGFSTGFKYHDRMYNLVKHGFWKNLSWNKCINKNSIEITSFKLADDTYPFSFKFKTLFKIIDDSLVIKTNISNISKYNVFFHFGYHPAFKIDAKTKLDINTSGYAINSDGKLTSNKVKNDIISSMKYGIDYDTIVYKNSKFKDVSYVYNYTKVTISFDSKNLQLWKPKDADFICIEPWYGWADKEYDAPLLVDKKREINKLSPGKTFTANMLISFKNN